MPPDPAKDRPVVHTGHKRIRKFVRAMACPYCEVPIVWTYNMAYGHPREDGRIERPFIAVLASKWNGNVLYDGNPHVCLGRKAHVEEGVRIKQTLERFIVPGSIIQRKR